MSVKIKPVFTLKRTVDVLIVFKCLSLNKQSYLKKYSQIMIISYLNKYLNKYKKKFFKVSGFRGILPK